MRHSMPQYKGRPSALFQLLHRLQRAAEQGEGMSLVPAEMALLSAEDKRDPHPGAFYERKAAMRRKRRREWRALGIPEHAIATFERFERTGILPPALIKTLADGLFERLMVSCGRCPKVFLPRLRRRRRGLRAFCSRNCAKKAKREADRERLRRKRRRSKGQKRAATRRAPV